MTQPDVKQQGSTFRLFIAIDISDAAVRELVQWQQRYLSSERDLRLTPAKQLHVTLVFLGQSDERKLEKIADQLERLQDNSCFAMTADHLAGLPKGRNPRVVAAAFKEPLERPKQLHDELARGLIAKRLYKKEKRPYFPHVTIARNRGRLKLSLADITPEPVKFTAVRVTLYNSILSPAGADHRPLKSIQLT